MGFTKYMIVEVLGDPPIGSCDPMGGSRGALWSAVMSHRAVWAGLGECALKRSEFSPTPERHHLVRV